MATVIMNMKASKGNLKVTTANEGDGLLSTPYAYPQGSSQLGGKRSSKFAMTKPVVGEQRLLEVTVKCKSMSCNYQYNIEFGCRSLDKDGVQVLSDVDDTIFCSGGGVGGVDQRLEKHEVYPGAAELYLGLALGPNGHEATTVPARSMLLSARPVEVKALLAMKQGQLLPEVFEAVGQKYHQSTWGLNVDGSQYGTISDLSLSQQRMHQKFGVTKANTLLDLTKSNPHTKYVWSGDNGQGDACAAQAFLATRSGKALSAVFIHEVQSEQLELKDCKSQKRGAPDFRLSLRDTKKFPNAVFFKSHARAAEWAMAKGLISCKSASIVLAAVRDWEACRCNGKCANNLLTGVDTKAKRQATLAYCAIVKKEASKLAKAVKAKRC